ncbi:MAG: leucine-rich repeat domain-containing protein, partial [Clostridia bacterium]|nr:leucine-rich repeat domain-containing protein [Clostridia bacterium]
ISGTGAMYNYNYEGNCKPPWKEEQFSSVVIGEGVTSIGEHAFYQMKSIVSVTIPESLKTIAYKAFRSCESLESINLGSMKNIYDSAFEGCCLLSSVDLSSAEKFGWCAFRGCNSLLSVFIPGKVDYLEENLFEGCANLQSVTLGEGIDVIRSEAFKDCESLSSVYIPTSLSYIDETSFSGCPDVTLYSPVRNCEVASYAVSRNNISVVFLGYTVSYLDEDGTVLETFTDIEYGSETPEYSGQTPTKDTDGQFSYTFSGWTPEIAETVKGNATYTATYAGEPARKNLRIVSQPSDWSGEWGEYPEIRVLAEGEGLIYQWYFRDAGKTDWSTSAEKDDCYNRFPLSEYRNGREVYCVIKDSSGCTVETEHAFMRRYIPEGHTGPTIMKEPESWAGEWGEYPEIRVYAEGDELSYHWYFRAAGATSWSSSSDRDDCYDSFTLTQSRNGREVFCRITDKYGNIVDSAVADMKLYIPEGYTGPEITQEPENWYGEWNEYPEVSVTANGIGLTYRWYFCDAGKTSWSASSDKDNCYDSYALTPGRRGRELKCVITDKYGNSVTTQIAVMDRYVPANWTGPQIVSQTGNWTGNWNDYPEVRFEVEGEEVTYQWYFRAAGETSWNKSSDRDNCYDNYQLTSARNGRELKCVATDKYGYSVTSDIVTMSYAG